jgi:hypothetical protein
LIKRSATWERSTAVGIPHPRVGILEMGFIAMRKLVLISPLFAIGLALAGAIGPAAAQPNNQNAEQANFGNLISALNNISAQVADVEVIDDITVGDVNVVNVEDVLNGNNINALNNALNRNDVDIEILQDAIQNNDVLNNVLNNANINIQDVVSIEVLSGGDIVVFTR